MARVFVDACIFGEKWFAGIVAELIKSKSVRFAYTDLPKMKTELERYRKLGEFYKLVGNMGLRDDVSEHVAKEHVDYLEGIKEWRTCGDCDDPHIFSVVYVLNTFFIFSKDSRMARCRTRINKIVDNKYCDFRLVSSLEIYQEKKREIFG